DGDARASADVTAEVGAHPRRRSQRSRRILDERRNVLDPSESVAESERGADHRAFALSGSIARTERNERSGTKGPRDHSHRHRGEQRRAAVTGSIANTAAIRLTVSVTERDTG